MRLASFAAFALSVGAGKNHQDDSVSKRARTGYAIERIREQLPWGLSQPENSPKRLVAAAQHQHQQQSGA